MLEDTKPGVVADRITHLSPAKRKLLAKLLSEKEKINGTSAPQAIPHQNLSEGFALSFVQERLWFLDQLFPNSILYNMAGANRVIGPLDEGLVVAAFNEIVRRHETLRTTYHSENGMPYPVVASDMRLTPTRIDLRHLADDEREASAREAMITEVKRPFNLSTGPLIRLALIRLADEEFFGLLTMHHIAADGVSTKVLFQEFGAIYQSFVHGQPSLLPELSLQYSDFAVWQREWLKGDRLQEQVAFWQEVYRDGVPTLQLPTDRPHPANPTFGGGRQMITIPSETTEGLKALSKETRATLFMVLLAAYKTYLYRISNQPDLVVGIPIAGRNRPELADMIGCFLNMLALRTNLSGNPTFRTLIARVQEQALAAYSHQDLPFEKLVEVLQPERKISQAPLTQVAFSFEENPTASFTIENLTMHFEELETGTAKMDLALELVEIMGGNGRSQLEGWFEYNTDIYDAATIARIADQFNTLLADIATSPDAKINTLNILPASEKQTLLVDWNNTDVDYPLDITLHQVFEEQVERTPDAIAIICGDQQLTYRLLNNRANQVAHYLRSLGITTESMVGLCMDRSIEMVVGVWGILKAGGTYVPIEAEHPEDRLAFVLADAEGTVVLTQEHLTARLPQDVATIICLDSEWPLLAQESTENLTNITHPKNLAYVLYTAGSTGQPKGVTVPHLDIVHHSWAFIDQQQMTADDNMLMFVSLIFDAAAAALYPPLFCGAKVVLPPISSAKLSTAELTRFCAEHQITITHLPAAFWHQWVDELETSGDAQTIPLRIIMTGGETPNIDKLRTWSRLFGRKDMTFFNAYGPTEAVVTITLQALPCDEDQLAKVRQIPAGRPIQNKKIYLLDDYLNLVPIGVPGEVHVGHIGLARNYLNHPSLSAEKFIPNPFSAEPGSFLYKTGDMARYLPDGTLEFIGRIDRQVKVRGFRVELSGIEATLAQHANVLENIVVVHSDFTGNNQLVAYIVPRENPAPSPHELQLFLSDSLPEYMLPQIFVNLDRIPLTTLGKADIKALPAPDWNHIERVTQYVAPRTDIEQTMATIWRDIIGVERIGVNDSFFDLGGHSLLATQVIAHIRESLGVELPMRLLFEAPTVAALAVEVSQRKAAGLSSGGQETAVLPTLIPDTAHLYDPFPLNEVQQAYWIGRSDMLEMGNVACHGYVEVDCLDIDLPRLAEAWRKLIARHPMLRAVMRPDGQQHILAEVPNYIISVIDLRHLDEIDTEIELVVMREEMSHQVIDCETWPLFDIRAAHIDDHRSRLFAGVDLLIADAWSFQILLQELQQFFENPAADLPQIEVSFRDYVLAEHALQDMEAYQQALAYWRDRLPTLPPGPELPLAINPNQIVQPQFMRRQSRLKAEKWQQLKARAAKAGLTPSGVLLAAYSEVLTTWSKNPHFTLTLTLFNRLPMHEQVNQIFGDFTSITLLEVDNEEPNSFEVRARRIQEQLWQDMDYRQVSGIRVQRELMRLKGGAAKSNMPVVFTSTLTQDGSDTRSSLAWLGELSYAIGQTPQVWLDHVVAEEEGALIFNWDSVDELFPEGMLAAMFDSYCAFLDELAENETAWQSLTRNLVPQAQLTQRAIINHTDAHVSDELLNTLFMQQAVKTPERTAVITPTIRLTYNHLYCRANQIGHYLQDRGVQPNQLVAIVMEKGWEQIVAAFGILHAGAAYLPIDATMPQERIWHLLAHGEAQFAITQPQYKESLEWPADVHVIAIDEAELLTQLETPPDVVQSVTDLAYVIYTSGSTGMPKGVVIDHRGAVNTVLDINGRYHVGPDDRVLALSALNFDLSVYDIFGLLAVGGAIVIPDVAARREPAHWLHLLKQEQVTIWNTVPALMGMLTEYMSGLEDTIPASLRLVMMSGDWIPLPLPREIRTLADNKEIVIYSLGGATEASIWSILYPITDVLPEWNSIPYGRPMVNQTFHVLDNNLEPCPIWVPGQLYIGGIGVALGYWRDEEKTNASFITHPRTGERLYRTGDLGRYLSSGDIEFLGREDFQVKVQGYRIELGEIESALYDYSAIARVVVTAVGERMGDKTLVAYLVLEEGQAVEQDDLREYLAERIPGYMIPGVFIILDSLPLTANGKIDRKALPSPDAETQTSETCYEAPRNDIEEKLVQLTTALIGVSRVGIYDNFFELGANSIHATQLITRVRDAFSIELPLRSVFEASSVAGLAEKIAACQWAESTASEPEYPMNAEFEEGVL